ncbi:UNVERIFIED_CONTAM: 3'-5' exonuclease domain-containing protein [Hammondia hammondi]|eukprot:XP_008882622.1 3'-5' exonuclease domain-containing protein [Hammondia hammondi]
MQATVSIPCARRHSTFFSSLCPPQLKSRRQLVRGKNRRGQSLLSRQRRETRNVSCILFSRDDSTPAGLPSFAAWSSSFFPQGHESSDHVSPDSVVSAFCCPVAWLSSSPTLLVSQRASRCLPPPVSPAVSPRSCSQSSSLSFVSSAKRGISFQRLLSHSSRAAPTYQTPGARISDANTQSEFSLSRFHSSFSLAPTQLNALHSPRIRTSAPPSFSLTSSSSTTASCSAPSPHPFPPHPSSPFSPRPLFSPPPCHPRFSSSFSPSHSPPSASRSRKVHLIDDPGDCDAILDELFFSPSSSALLLPPSPLTTHLMVHRQMSASSLSSSASPSTSSSFLSGDFSRQLVALDCEGVALGRFGRACTVQLATPTHTLLLDALKPGVVGGNRKLKDVLESPHVVKVCHDCREDASALLHQHNIRLRNVFDTQVAHQIWSEQKKDTVFQASLSELFRSFLNLRDGGVSKQAKSAMEADPSVWCQRPLPTDLLRYAVFGVSHLLDLAHVLSFHLSSCNEVIRRSGEVYLPYRHLNTHLNSPAEIASPGAVIQGMVAARTCVGLTLKLNCGRNGVVSTPAALSRFHDVKLGDIVDVQVASQSQDGQTVYLDRYDGLYNYWNLKERPRTRHQTAMALTSESQVDPLLLLTPDEDEVS